MKTARLSLIFVLCAALGCSSPLGLEDVTGVYASGPGIEGRPAGIGVGHLGVMTFLADTLILNGDGTGTRRSWVEIKVLDEVPAAVHFNESPIRYIVRGGRLGLLPACDGICTSDAPPPTWYLIVGDGLLNVQEAITYRRTEID